MTERQQLDIGRNNRLQVVKDSDFGLFLDGYRYGEILLPRRYSPDDAQPGDWLEVFVYADSEDRLIATTETPRAMVGEVAYLRVAAANSVGAFLDWGLPKDLLVPFSEQSERMQEGFSYAVYIYVDNHTDRIVASSKLSKFVPEEFGQASVGMAVDLLVCGKSDMGFKCLVDRSYLALLHHADVFQPLQPGRTLPGFVKYIRADGRIDLSLSPPGTDNQGALEQQIKDHLEANGGQSNIGDKSPPEEIYRLFGTSKKNFKRALSRLYKTQQIVIDRAGISLNKD